MEPRVVDNPDQRRFEIYLGDELAGFSSYAQLGDGQLVVFIHTEIEERFAGRGLASTLIKHSLDTMRERGVPVIPMCPFVRRYIAEHGEYRNLVPEQLRDALDQAAS